METRYFFWEKFPTNTGPHHLGRCANSTLRGFRLARSASSCHDTLSTRSFHIFVLTLHRKPMSHSCDYQKHSERLAGLSCVSLSGVCTDYTEYWVLHCHRATGPKEIVGFAHQRTWFGQAGFLFWLMVVLLSVWVCLLLFSRAGLD